MSLTAFRKKLGVMFSVVMLLLNLTGCAYLVVGGIGVLGGYVVSPDTVQGMVSDYDMEDVWEAAVEVVSIMGVIEEQSEMSGILIAKIQGAKVTVTLMPMTKDDIKITIKARKTFFPKINIAQEVYTKMYRYLEG